MLRIFSLALLAGCGAESHVVDAFAPQGDTPIVEAPSGPDRAERGGLVGFEVGRLVPGSETTFTVTGLSAGELVHIARSTHGEGEGPCLGTLDGLCLDIAGPAALHASGTADDDGLAVLEPLLPAFVPIGADVSFQAVVPRGATGISWLKSEAVSTVVEDATKPLALLEVGDLLITEVMARPAALRGEYVEVLNASGTDLNLDGLRISTSTGAFELSGTTYVAPGAYVIFGASDDPDESGGVMPDILWPEDIALEDSWGEFVLTGTDLLDAVAWDDGAAWPLGDGAAMSLLPSAHTPEDNDRGENWCEELGAMPGGDLGSPGAPDTCSATLTHTIMWGESEYATMDDMPIDGIETGCQDSPLPLPSGWELAPFEEGIDAFINEHPWSTMCMVLADGASYSGSAHRGAPGSCGDESLDAADDTYWVVGCHRRILIRRAP
jgi:hypothetical protein